MKKNFKSIGLIGHPRHTAALATLTTQKMLFYWLVSKGYEVIVEYQVAHDLKLYNVTIGSLTDIGQQADLAVVVGGDGSMLGAARILARYDIKVIGVNLGKIGFLADLNPKNIKQQLLNVINGAYFSEQRFLLEAQVFYKNQPKSIGTAINEVVLHPGKVAHMIDFEVYINETFAFSQRADGLIISTPTGSTAYSLSANGPILTPSLHAISLIPMFPHTLSARPLVIDSNSKINLRFGKFSDFRNVLELNCDGQIILLIHPGDEVTIQKSKFHLNLIHPKKYNYFNILNNKLGWSKKFF
ncbi:NAD kinase [Candidatus Profftia lariciata]|uniref:NAD(+) kinase n=1 Tax=Candidatus Profftia lariciata TaxID=1987921 RepID=UPI001D035345|nr:NAD(+) kinase [Candidatus Profftia lariciata]UDG81280.1 NAD kinase [Candidatus Profftia lariciata]